MNVRSLKQNARLIPEQERWAFLTPKQREVILYIARGYRVCEISQKLKISQSALMTHKVRAFDWLCLSCDADATAYAIKYKLIDSTLGVVIRAPRPSED